MNHRTANFVAAIACLLFAANLTCAGEAGDANAPIKLENFKEKIIVACVGDSITAGSGTKNSKTDSYPSQLQKMLGDKWTVKNFGVSGATLLKKGDKPYDKQSAYKTALASKPDVVVIMLGTNDTKPQNWKMKDQYAADYKALIADFAQLETKPRVFICYPPHVPGAGNFGINEAGVLEAIPMVDAIAKESSAGVINMHAPLKGQDKLLPDRVHPNTEGATLLANAVHKALTGKDAEPTAK